MEYLLGALTGAILFFGGFMLGRSTAPREEKETTAPNDIALTANDSKRERARKMDAQYFNLMNYTGRRQIDEDYD